MNQLTSTTLNTCTVQNSYITNSSLSDTSLFASITIHADTTVSIDSYQITGKELVQKLELLDKLIAKYYPELLI